MEKKYYVVAVCYTCYDWHDWQQETCVVTNENGEPKEVSEKEVFLEAFKAITGAEEGSYTQISEMIYKFEGTTFRFEKKGDDYKLIVITEEPQITYEVVLEVIDAEITDTVFLPIREYIGFPKIAPLVQRCFCKPFGSKKEAFNYVFPDCHSEYCDREADIILPISQKKLFSDDWYKANEMVFSNRTKDEITKGFIPNVQDHLKALGLYN